MQKPWLSQQNSLEKELVLDTSVELPEYRAVSRGTDEQKFKEDDRVPKAVQKPALLHQKRPHAQKLGQKLNKLRNYWTML